MKSNSKAPISRRTFAKATALAATAAITSPILKRAHAASNPLRMGGPLFDEWEGPAEWISALQNLGYSAAYCPIEPDAPDRDVAAFAAAAKKANIVIAEVGVYNNTLGSDPDAQKAAIEEACEHLDLADRIGANCCVNLAGSRSHREDPRNLTDETFDMVVEVTRKIIDTVKPKRTYYTLEPLPWAFPTSPDDLERLVNAMDRERLGVHLDPVNVITSHQRYYGNGAIIADFFKRFGTRIKSCHAKDIELRDGFPVNLQECQPGLGNLAYDTYLREAAKLPVPPPLMLEHLPSAGEYVAAATYLRQVASKENLTFK